MIDQALIELIREFNSIGMKSEDFLFCEKARELGFKIFCDTTIRLGHIIESVVKCEEPQ